MVVVTGAAGFVGSCLAKTLIGLGADVVVVDDFSVESKASNLIGLKGAHQVDRSQFFDWLVKQDEIDFIFHLGARTDTTEFNYAIFEELNLEFSKKIWNHCARTNVPLIYASSAATYGSGELGYHDDHEIVFDLKPLNPYGVSKNEFDKWALDQPIAPPAWYGLKFFNVYGPNEYHKGRMASVVLHAYNQICSQGSMKLFRSHNQLFKDGEQMRDFVYVKDVLKVIRFLEEHRPVSGLYNLGSGKARSFLDLVNSVFQALEKRPEISFIDTPADIRDNYQYFTEANMAKLIKAGYLDSMTSLEDGVNDYVTRYLMPNRYY